MMDEGEEGETVLLRTVIEENPVGVGQCWKLGSKHGAWIVASSNTELTFVLAPS